MRSPPTSPPTTPPARPPAAIAILRASATRLGLAELNLTVAPAELVTLLGTGTGPSAVLALLAGFARADAGELLVAGFAFDRTPAHHRGLGVVPRGLALFPHLDVAAHAGFSPGVTRAQAEAVLHRLGLTSFARRLPHQLSPELRLRVALARALAPAPTVLLLDDPLAGLPTGSRAAVKDLLRALCTERGMAVLHATGDVAHALGLSDRIGVMQAGRLLQLAAPRTLYEDPVSLSVATSLGPVNRLAGTKLDQEDDIARIRIDSSLVVEAKLVDEIADGAACVVTIRPERIAVAGSDMGEGAIPARLVEALFEGEHTRLRFALGDSAIALIASRPAGLPPPRGPAVSLAWQPHHAHAFRPEAA